AARRPVATAPGRVRTSSGRPALIAISTTMPRSHTSWSSKEWTLRARLAAVAVLVCAVSACTAGEKSDERPDAGPAPDALSAAIDGWTESNSGRFRFFLGDENDYLMATESAYLLAEDRVELGTI